jgi:hypothetical protein
LQSARGCAEECLHGSIYWELAATTPERLPRRILAHEVPVGQDRGLDTKMKLGIGRYKHMLSRESFQFARRAAASRVVSIPGHNPQMASAAPWHSGVAHALGSVGAPSKAFDELGAGRASHRTLL